MKSLLKHQTTREELLRFLLLLAVLAIYFIYLSLKYGLATGGLVSFLTWSFFVFCTPVADAGFLVAFPVRLITGTRMLTTQIVAGIIALLLNIWALLVQPEVYQKTLLTQLLYKILITPWPYWSIILLCAAGTFLSIRFGDELMDVTTHKECDYQHKHGFKYRLIFIAGFVVLIVIAYYHLLITLGIDLPKG